MSPNEAGKGDQYHIEEVTLNSDFANKNPDVVGKIAEAQYQYSKMGMRVALICIIGGLILFLFGVTGSISWSTSILGAKSKLADAAPGAVLFVVGLFIAYLSRFSVTISESKPKTPRTKKNTGAK